MMRNLGAVILLAALAACTSSGSGAVPSAGGAALPAARENTRNLIVGRLAPDSGVAVGPNVGIGIHSALIKYEYENRYGDHVDNGSCTIRHVGYYAVGCVVYFYFGKSLHIQKAQIGLYTKYHAEGCIAGLSPLYKDFNVYAGEELKVKTFYWTGKC